MADFRRTYDELREIIAQACRLLEHKGYLIKHGALSRDEVLYCIACRFFAIDLQYPLRMFRSNRYFLDALGMELFPLPGRVSQMEQLIADYSAIDTSLDQVLNETLIAAGILKSAATARYDVERFLTDGYLILENVLHSDLCDQLADLVRMHASIERRSGRGGYVYGNGKMQRVYNLVSKGHHFRQLLEVDAVHDLMEWIFRRDTFHSKYYLSSFHANILGPGADSQIWHIDANVPEPLPPWSIRANANFVIQDYSAANGATEVIPGSHRLQRKPGPDEIDAMHPGAIPLDAKKGSIVVWHGYLWHRSGSNKSQEDRIALLSTYAAGFFREVCLEENIYLASSLADQNLFSTRLKRILGWSHGLKDHGD